MSFAEEILKNLQIDIKCVFLLRACKQQQLLICNKKKGMSIERNAIF